MRDEISDQLLLSALRKGVKRSSDLIAQITDYHGGPVTTEYMLTSAIARELIEQRYEVEVEYLNRKMINGMTMRKSGAPRKEFGSRRTDIAVLMDKIFPLAIVEVKIGVKTLNGTKDDLLKITDTIGSLKPQFASRVRGAAVFQVHVAGSAKRFEAHHFKAAIEEIERSLGAALKSYGKAHAGFHFALHALQSKGEGVVARELESDGDGLAWGRHGHATRYYAVLVRSKQRATAPPRTLAELKKQMNS
jgi:hypothetical protein